MCREKFVFTGVPWTWFVDILSPRPTNITRSTYELTYEHRQKRHMNWSLYVVFVSVGMSFLSMLRSTVKKGECNVEKSFFVKFQMCCESKDIYVGAWAPTLDFNFNTNFPLALLLADVLLFYGRYVFDQHWQKRHTNAYKNDIRTLTKTTYEHQLVCCVRRLICRFCRCWYV